MFGWVRGLAQIALSLLALIAVVTILGAMNASNKASTTGSVQPSPASTSDSDCQAAQAATDGTPPVGMASRLDPQRLCGALAKAEAEAECMGDWQPPARISARELCVQVQQRGCDTSG